MPTVALVVIGDEILSGKFADENGPWLISRLRDLGSDLERMAVIRDDVSVIADEVSRCSRRFDRVITSGGVGPTHDDVTMEGVARAFGLPLEERQELVDLVRRYELPEEGANRRMVMVPRGCDLLRGEALPFPVCRVRNVYVFPGVPRLFRAKFGAVSDHFAGARVGTTRLYTAERENDIAEPLAAVAAEHSGVSIGSYPRYGDDRFKVLITVESRDPAALEAAIAAITSRLPVVDLTEG